MVGLNVGSWLRSTQLIVGVAAFACLVSTMAGRAAAPLTSSTGDNPAQVDPTAPRASPDLSGSSAPNVVDLGPVWKFETDPKQIGMREHWFAENADDASWSNLRSGRSWESQGIRYAGYAWYRQRFALPENFRGKSLKITLAELDSDDEVFFNGVRIGGLKGDYKYKNLLLRTYIVPAQTVHAPGQNTLAIRLWGGRLGFHGAKSGLVAGRYTIEPEPFGLAARDVGTGAAGESPIQLHDLTDAQRGRPFELVFRFHLVPAGLDRLAFSYELTDFYGKPLTSGSAPLSAEQGEVAKAVVRIDADAARKIYLAGRFKAVALVKEPGSGRVVAQDIVAADHLSFARRGEALPALPDTVESTPYGRLRLVDVIDAATPDAEERHPYLQSGFGVHAQDFMTPGAEAQVSVGPILGRGAREASWSWFAYRIGRGRLVPGRTYLVRISYPEDKPRFAPIEIQAGQNYMDLGWKNGVAADDVYDDWPLSHAWQDYDVVVPLGSDTLGTGGAGDGDAAHGFWIYFMDQRKPGAYFSDYKGGPAVSTIKLYEIDPTANAPRLTLPEGLPRRMMTFDWERQPTAPPRDVVAYAKLMGYSAVSPTILKWGLTNYADPVPGFTSAGVDAAGYWVTDPPSALPTRPESTDDAPAKAKSIHAQYLDATRASGIDYVPRVEYGGSTRLPVWARAIGADGRPARPDRYAAWGADLLDPATLADFKSYIGALFRPYAKANPQLKGMLWRIREDRMQISYSAADVALFARESHIDAPNLAGATPADAAQWATTPAIAPSYTAWWQKKRAAFHADVARYLQSFRPDMTLLYFNWDQDKFSLLQPDRASAAFFARLQAVGGPTAYADDAGKRRRYSAADYTSALATGQFASALPQIKRPGAWPDYALVPSLYAKIDGVQLLAPVPGLPYANMPDYLNYFRTMDGLAVADMVAYDEVGAREPNPKYEGAVVLPGGAPFSMAVELLAYYYGDARTLTYTSYTYGRGFADAHRRFAQAFRALPAIAGTLVPGVPENVAVRLYPTAANGTYVGIAYKGYQSRSFAIDLPGRWSKTMTVKDLATGEAVPFEIVERALRLKLRAEPMALQALLVR